MNQKRINTVLTVVLVVCLAIAAVGWVFTRTTSRDATAEELAKYGVYDVLWDTMPQAEEGQNLADRILALATLVENTQVGENQYDTYTSETLAACLYKCQQVDQILTAEDGAVYISYTDTDGLGVILSYQGDSLYERSVYVPETDILFYQSGDTVVVYEHASNGMTS